jgi:ribosomal protein S27E
MTEDDDKDPPIEPQNFLGGVKVVDIGDIRVSRGLSRRHHAACKHRAMVYDNQERRVWCTDCERNVDGFDAFVVLVENFSLAESAIRRKNEEANAARTSVLHLIAVKVIEKMWRGKTMAIACPHCRGGLLPEDFTNGVSGCSAEIERARRNKGKK